MFQISTLVLVVVPQCCFAYFFILLPNVPTPLVITFFFPFKLLQKPKSMGILRYQKNNRETVLAVYLCYQSAFKSYSKTCNRNWFRSADLPHPVWKKYWQSILHWLKIIATVPLPCSNLPLDHSRQGHRVHHRDRSEGGTTGQQGTEQGTRSFFKRGWRVKSNF